MGGAVIPEKVTIEFDGKEINLRTYNPAVAHEYGISTVHQELMQANDISVGENIFMGRYPLKYGKVDWKKLNADAQSFLNPIDEKIKSSAILGNLSMAHRQMVEIAKATSYNAKIIIFDEPTSSLTEEETDRLFKIIRKLKANGTAIIYISHRLEEIFEISDRITVLRDGTMIGTKDIAEVTTDSLISMMVGRDLSNLYPKEVAEIGDVVLKIEGLSSSIVKDINLEVRAGEILGIGGLAGQGKLGIPNGVMGLYEAGGTVEFEGKPIPLNSPRSCLDANIAFVSEDRRGVGLLLDETLEWNVAFPAMQVQDKFLKKLLGGLIKWRDEKAISEVTDKYIEELMVKCTGSKQKARELSGGNQQKICLAKAFALEPKFLFVSEPTRGIDVGAKSLVLEALKKFNRESGVTVVMISSELEELRQVCDRIAIVSGGRIAGILPASDSSEDFGMLMVSQVK